MKNELVISIILLVGSVTLYASLSLMEEPAAVSFPRVVISIMVCLGLELLIQIVITRQRSERPVLQYDRVVTQVQSQNASGSTKGFPFVRLVSCFLLIVIYFMVMEDLGFYLSAFLFFIAVTVILGRKDLTLRKGTMRIGTAFIFTAILFILFNKLLVVQTPKGLFF